MTKTRFPVDEHGIVSSAQDWERAQRSLERHLATAARSPRFEETREEIAARPTLKELLLSADGRVAKLAPPKTSVHRRKPLA